MGFKLDFNEQKGVLYIIFVEEVTPDDVCKINNLNEMVPREKTEKIIVDISSTKMSTWAKPWDRETRRRVAESVPPNPLKSKVAIIGSSSVSRMLTKVGLTVIGKIKDSKFFKSEEDALAWLKGDK